MKLAVSLLFFCFLQGALCQSNGLNIDAATSALGDLKDEIDINKFKKIQKPDDIPQIKDWKDDCRVQHGEETVKLIEEAPGELMTCVLQYVKPNKLQIEVNRSMDNGNLDRVFKKYCGYRGNILSCVDDMLDKFRTCMTPQQLIDINVTRTAVDAAIDFICHDDGDRIALFMAEEGVECLKQHRDGIRECSEAAVPELKQTMQDPESLSLDNIVINKEQCGKLNAIHACIERETSKCSDPTPANILDALITQMLKVTPCWQIKIRQAEQQQQSAAAGGGDTGASTSGAAAAAKISGGFLIDTSSLGSLVRSSVASIGPIAASCVGGAAGIGVVLSAIWSYIVAMISTVLTVVPAGVSVVVMAVWSYFVAMLSTVLTGLWSYVETAISAIEHVFHYFIGLTPSVAFSYERDGNNESDMIPSMSKAWVTLSNVWVSACSSVSVSSLLVLALAAITALNILF